MKLNVALLSIGTELTRGELSNTNASWLATELAALGEPPEVIETIPDSISRIQETLERLARDYDPIICTGGLGPTTDDLTCEAAAATIGRIPVIEPQSEARLMRFLEERGREPTGSVLQQVRIPETAEPLVNHWGLACGFKLTLHGANIYCMPGVPREMKPMFERYVVADLLKRKGVHTHQVRFQTYGTPESEANDLLDGIEAHHSISIGYRVHYPQLEIKCLAVRPDAANAKLAAEAASVEVRQRLGQRVFSSTGQSLTQAVGELLEHRGWSLAVAESCTGGLISALFCEHACSSFYRGGVVTYSNQAKTSQLGVDTQTLDTAGAVSEEVVQEMAAGVAREFQANASIAISGIAGPTGGTAEKPVGLVCYCVRTPEETRVVRRVFLGDRARIQKGAAFAAIDLLRSMLL